MERAILFACTQNAVRSPMAAAMLRHLTRGRVYIESAGVKAGELDPLAVEAMAEIGLEIGKHRPRRFEDLEDGTRLQIDPKAIRAEYTREMQHFLDTLKRRCGQFGMDYVLAMTDVPWETQVRDVLRSLSR